MDTTMDLLKDCKELRDMIAEYGPNDNLLAQRRVYEAEVLAQQLEQDYLALKAKYPHPIEHLELAEPLTAEAKRNLDEAAAVNKEIEKLLGGSRKGNGEAKH
jgi:hypothetical protein